MFFMSSMTFFNKILSGTLSEYQTVLIEIRPNIMSGLIWVQTVCKDYQLTTKVTASKEYSDWYLFPGSLHLDSNVL